MNEAINPARADMLDHLGIVVSDLARSQVFYQTLLATLSYQQIMEVTAEQSGAFHGFGFGPSGRPQFWISQALSSDHPAARPVSHGLHIAFGASNRAQVDAFYQTALSLGATDNGAPGLRPYYHPNYYGAFVLDLDGNNIEAVCHHAPNSTPES